MTRRKRTLLMKSFEDAWDRLPEDAVVAGRFLDGTMGGEG